MKQTKCFLSAILIISVFSCASHAKGPKKPNKGKDKMIESITKTITKGMTDNNPLLPNFFCADPTAVEYEGRLYVFATSDQQMYKMLKPNEEVNYGYINSLAIMSSADMANWTYHGELNVSSVAKWAKNAWAPSIVSRTEGDGLTHFYLYFANGGNGIGVLTATSPMGPWKDPLGKALISHNTKGLGRCDWLFDPGVVIDDAGTGWITFGGSGNPECNKIARLGNDMISLDSDIVYVLNAKDHFEANELNYINGTYIWSYCTKWGDLEVAPVAAMACVSSKTPLDADSWKYDGDYFKNQATFGLGGGNNHTHLHKFKGNYYLIYQAHDLHEMQGIKGDCRNVNIDKATVDEENAKVNTITGSKAGVSQIENLPARGEVKFATLANGADFEYNQKSLGEITVSAKTADGVGAWTLLKGVQFDSAASKITVKAKGNGVLKVCIDKRELSNAATLNIDSKDFATVESAISVPAGVHNIYFVFSNGTELDWWKCE